MWVGGDSREVVQDSPSLVPGVGIWFEEFSHVHDHGEFIQLLVNAKASADLHENSVEITWRGYTCVLKPNEGPITKQDYKLHLLHALKSLNLDVDDNQNSPDLFKEPAPAPVHQTQMRIKTKSKYLL